MTSVSATTPSATTANHASTPNTCMRLTHLGVLEVSGAQARQFLQGQLSCDLARVSHTTSTLGDYCNLKGRALTSFYLCQNPTENTTENTTIESFYLVMDHSIVAITQSTLHRYAIFSQVTVTDASDRVHALGIHITNNTTQTTQAIAEITGLDLLSLTEPDHTLATAEYIGIRVHDTAHRYLILTTTETVEKQLSVSLQTMNFSHWLYLEILAGLGQIEESTREKLLPLALNHHLFDAISFKKGCYLGQEIIARTYYRGQLKQSLYQGVTDDTVDRPRPTLPANYEWVRWTQGPDQCGYFLVLAPKDAPQNIQLVAGDRTFTAKLTLLPTEKHSQSHT